MRARFAFVAILAACSGGSREKAGHTQDSVGIGPVPDTVTKATLAGPLCEGDKCTCRDLNAAADGGAGAPATGDQKRFEFHIGPASIALWVRVDDMVLYKSDEHAEDCFYVDLTNGAHKIELRGSQDGGLSAALDVHEYGPQSKSWYDTFHFNCGSPGACSTDELDEWKGELTKYKRGLQDPCGSTKVRALTWDAGQAPDQQHPKDLQVDFTLEIYGFEPDKAHGDPQCANNY
jgi:hypothetical protein